MRSHHRIGLVRFHQATFILISFLCLAVGQTALAAEELFITNSGFEAPVEGKDIPGWETGEHTGQWNGGAYEFTIDSTPPKRKNHVMRVRQIHPEVYGLARQEVPIPKGATGRELVLSARTRTEDVGAQGWILVATFKQAGAIIRQHRSTPITGTHDWQRVSLPVTIPPNATGIEISFMLLDKGTAWVDDVSLQFQE